MVSQQHEFRVSSDTVDSTPIRLLLLLAPEAAQRFQFRLLDGSSKTELGSVVLGTPELLASTPTTQPFKLALPSSSKSSGEEVDALAEQLYGDMAMRLKVIGAPAGAAAGASQAAQPIRWAQFGSFDRSASRAALTGQAGTYEVALAVAGLFSFDATSKSSPLVSVHAFANGAPVDHTEVAHSTHATSFQQKVMMQPGTVLRVYDASAGTALDDAALIGFTAPLTLAQLEAGVELELTNSNAGLHKRLQKKAACVRIVSVAQVGSSSANASSSSSSSTASPKGQQQLASSPKAAAPTPKASPTAAAASASAGLQVQVPVPAPVPVVAAAATPFDSSVLSFTASQIVLVDAAGKEHRAPTAAASGSKSPKSPSAAAGSVSVNLSARNLPKVQALSSNISPLVAIWERVGSSSSSEEAAYVLLAHTEPVANQSDPAFAATLTINLAAASASAASPKAAASTEYRIDVYDVSEPRVHVQSERVGMAFLSRADLLALGSSSDYSAEKVLHLTLPSNPRMDKKLQARRSVVVLVRAGAPEAQRTQRELERTKSLADKKAAREKATTKLQAKRTGMPLPESPQPVEPVPAAVAPVEPAAPAAAEVAPVAAAAVVAPAAAAAPEPEAAAVADTEPVAEQKKQPEAQPEPAQLAAVPTGLPPLGAGSRRGSMNAGAGSRRGSFSGVASAEGESTADMDNAILAEKVAQARVLSAQAAVDAFQGAGKKNKVAEDRHAAEADLQAAEQELVAASERAATAKKDLAARRKARAEAAEVESKRKAEADAAAAANPNQTLWGVRKRGPSMHIGGGGASAGAGSARNSPAGSISLVSSSADLEGMVTARRMAALNPAAQAQLALLEAGSVSAASAAAPVKSCVLCLNVSVQHIKNSGTWNPLVAFYERAAPAAASAAASSAADSFVFLDATEKISGVGETGCGTFRKQVLLEALDGGAQQTLRINLFNAGSKDEALSAADLIGSGSLTLAQLLAATTGEAKGKAVEVFLYSAGNHALSDRLKRQHASVVLSVAALWEAPATAAAAAAGSEKHSLILGAAPVPLVMHGGDDPEPSATTFAAVEPAATQAGASSSASGAKAEEPVAAPAPVAPAAAKESPAGSRDASDNEAEDATPAAAAASTEAGNKKNKKKHKKKAGK